MKDVLIPLGLITFLCVFVCALITTARKQRQTKAAAFADLARDKGLRYEAADDGTAQQFAHDLDGLGHFRSPSLGERIPVDIVSGLVGGVPVVLFRHATRFYEGYSREWFVAGVSAGASIAERCSVQFSKRRVATDSMYLKDPVVKEKKAGAFHLLVRAPDEASASKMLDDGVLSKLSQLASDLPFVPEIQIRANRVAVYLAERNATVETAADLQKLLDFSTAVATAS